MVAGDFPDESLVALLLAKTIMAATAVGIFQALERELPQPMRSLNAVEAMQVEIWHLNSGREAGRIPFL